MLFLDHLASTYACQCQTGRSGSGDAIVSILSSILTRLRVYHEYVDEFESLRKETTPFVTTEVRSDPLTFSCFSKNWNMDRPHLRVAKLGCSFCDCCTSLKNCLFYIEKIEEKYEVLNNLLDLHR